MCFKELCLRFKRTDNRDLRHQADNRDLRHQADNRDLRHQAGPPPDIGAASHTGGGSDGEPIDSRSKDHFRATTQPVTPHSSDSPQKETRAIGSNEKLAASSQTPPLPNIDGPMTPVKKTETKMGPDTIGQPTHPKNGDQTLMTDNGARASYEEFKTKDQTKTRNNHGAVDDDEEKVEKKPQKTWLSS